MAFGGFSKEGNAAPMAEINMIPLIDVMLVMLVIFSITAPLLTHAVKVDLPKVSSQPNITKPDNVQLAIDAEARVYWNGTLLDRAGWRAQMASPQAQPAARGAPAPTVPSLTAGAEVMSDAAKAGLTRIGFVTDPRE
jgi:biopolymer transport protein ExbD